MLQAVDYYDGHCGRFLSLSKDDPQSPHLCGDIAFLSARAHYINGVGYYERDSVVEACEEYLKALEVMESNFGEKELVGKKAKFMVYTYNRLTELFSSQFMMDPAIECGEQALRFCKIEPLGKYTAANILYHLGKQYDKMGESDNALKYYNQALIEVPDSNNYVYRNIMSNKTLLDYQKGLSCKQATNTLRSIMSQSENSEELFTRHLTLGAVLFEEGVYDTALYYLLPVYENKRDQGAQIQAAKYLRVIYDSLGDKEQTDGCVRFLADSKESEGENKALVSKLEDTYESYLNQKQQKKAEADRKKAVKKAISTIIPIAVVLTLALVVFAKLRSKKLLKKQRAEAEQRLKNVETQHLQWMSETKERQARELTAQIDMSEKEIAEIRRRHEEELEAERKKYQEERDALLNRLQSKETKVFDLEKNLDQQREEVVSRREDFLREPICQHINGLVHGRHITTRDTTFQHDDIALKEEALKQLKEAVERHYRGFDEALLGRYPSLKHSDLVQCHLHLLGMNEREIAALISRTYSGIKKKEVSLKEKFGVKNVAKFVLEVAEQLCVPQDVPQGVSPNVSQETIRIILEMISNNPKITREEIAEQLGVSTKTIGRYIKKLGGCVRYVGSGYSGHWEVLR